MGRTDRYKKSFTYAAVAVLIAIATEASAFDFKGLVLGEPTTPARVEAVFATCAPFRGEQCNNVEQMLHDRLKITCGLGHQGMMVCNGSTTIAGFLTMANIVIGQSGSLQRIALSEIDPDNFDELREQLVAKFGPPKRSEQSRVQNSFGAQYQQFEYEWSDARGRRILLRKYADRVDKSSVTFDTPEDRAMLNQRRGKKGDL